MAVERLQWSIDEHFATLTTTAAVQAGNSSIELARAMMHDKDEVAKRHGFQSREELLAISEALPMLPCDVKQIYIARRPDGRCFVWLEEPQPKPPASEQQPAEAITGP